MKKKAPDYLKNYIKELLLPAANVDGFQLYRPKELIRIKGPFLEFISFQLSQYGNKKFYVHYYKKLLGDPLLEMSGYNLGYRLSNNRENDDDTEWVGLEDLQARLAIESVVDAYRKTISVWFDETGSIPGFVFSYFVKKRSATINNLRKAVAFHEAGEHDRAHWIVNDIVADSENMDKKHLSFCYEYLKTNEAENIQLLLNDDRAVEHMNRKDEMPEVPNTEHKTVEALLRHWREENIVKYQLQKYL